MKPITQTIRKPYQKITKQVNNKTIKTSQFASNNPENKASNKSTSYKPTQNAKINIDMKKNKKQPVQQFMTIPQSHNDVFKKIKIPQYNHVSYGNRINTQMRKTQKVQVVKNNELLSWDNLNRMYLALKYMLYQQKQMEKDPNTQQIVEQLKHILQQKQRFYQQLDKIVKSSIKKINPDAPQLSTRGEKQKTQQYVYKLAKKLQQQIDQAIALRKKQKDDLQKKQRQQKQYWQKQVIYLQKKEKSYLIDLIHGYRISICALKASRNHPQNSNRMLHSYSSTKFPITELNASKQNNPEQTLQYIKLKEQQISLLKTKQKQQHQQIQKLLMENKILKNNPDIILKQQLQMKSLQLEKIRDQNTKTFIQNQQIKGRLKKCQYLQSKLTQINTFQQKIGKLRFEIEMNEQILRNLQIKVRQKQKIKQHCQKIQSQCQKNKYKVYQLKNKQKNLSQSIQKLQKIKQETHKQFDQHKNRMRESISQLNQQHSQQIHNLKNNYKQKP